MHRLFFALLLTAVMVAPARADLLDDCGQEADPNLSLSACTQLIEAGGRSDESMSVIYFNRGNAHRIAGQPQKAVDDFTRAIELDPTNPYPYNNRGSVLGQLGDLPGAVRDFTSAIERNPSYGRAYLNRGLAFERAGNFERAIADTERSIELDGPSRVRNLQEYLKNAGQYAGAVDGEYNQATRTALHYCIRSPSC